ncbi:MAG: hypothetical protein ACR2MY_09655 [Candidatus Dormibacteria bacterium]
MTKNASLKILFLAAAGLAATSWGASNSIHGAAQAAGATSTVSLASLPGVTSQSLQAYGLLFSAPTSPAGVAAPTASQVATSVVGSGSIVVGQPLLASVRNLGMPQFASCVCWVMEVQPLHPIQDRAPGHSKPLGTAYLAFVDAERGTWLYGIAGDFLP